VSTIKNAYNRMDSGDNLQRIRSSVASLAAFYAHRVALAVSTLLLTGPPEMAQYVERIDVSISNIDVVVTDRSGRPVRGLSRDDFEVKEGGQPQTITNFSAYDSGVAISDVPEAVAEARVAEPPQPRPRMIGLFVDIDEIEPIRRRQFFEGVRAFLDSALRKGDMVTILTWDHRVRVLLPPTSSHEAVRASIDILSRANRWSEAVILRQAAEMLIAQAVMDAEFASSVGKGANLIDPQAEIDFQEWLSGERRCAKIKRKAAEVRNVLTSVFRLDAQKLLILASDDFSQNPHRTCDTALEITALANAANAYGVAIHAFHPSGDRGRLVISPERGNFLPGTRDPSLAAVESTRTFNESTGLQSLAHQTGGLAAVGAGMSSERLEQAAEQLEHYYSIGYRFSPGLEDRPRTIKVTTKNRAYRVRARQSVVRLSETARLRDELTANLYLPPQHGFHSPEFKVRIDSMTREGRFSVVHLRLSISARDLTRLSTGGEKKRGSFSVFVVAGRELGDASPLVELKQNFESASDADDARVIYSFAVRVRPDTRRLSIAVRDETSGDVATTLVMLNRDGLGQVEGRK
jgi:VWFA-related protein